VDLGVISSLAVGAGLRRWRRSPRAGDGDAGFSIIEVMVAAVILFVVALGVVTLMTRSMMSNQAGADSTSASQAGISREEQLYQLDFNNAVLTPGTTTEYYSRNDERWKAGTAPADDPALWTRTTVVTQFGLPDLFDDGIFNDPLPIGTDPAFVHIKRIEVTVASARDAANPIGSRRSLVLRTLKPF
jgi:type II secretory pathway pseudopilin PulG